MPKEKERRKVLLDVNEDWLRNRGGEYHARKWWKVYLLPIALLFIISIAAVLGGADQTADVLTWVLFGVLCVELVIFMYAMQKRGKRFWEEWKDKPEPLELPKLPRWWGKDEN